MYRLGQLFVFIGILGLFAPCGADPARAGRDEGKDATPSQSGQGCAACGEDQKTALTADMICPLYDIAHHDGYCDYYAMICTSSGQSPTTWPGPHGHSTGPCGSGQPPCVPRFKEKKYLVGHDDLARDGYKRKAPNEAKKLEWNPTPAFNETATQKVRNVTTKYVTYRKKHKAMEMIHAEVVEFEASLDFGLHWEKMRIAFEIEPRTGVEPDVRYGPRQTDDVQGEHIHKLKDGTTIVTNWQTPDHPE